MFRQYGDLPIIILVIYSIDFVTIHNIWATIIISYNNRIYR